MPNAKIAAPANPKNVGKQRLGELRAKKNRTAAETAELLDLLVDRIADLVGVDDD